METPDNPVAFGRYRVGRGCPLLVIAGPCVIETEELTLEIATRLKQLADELPIQLVFKASFDKANRTSADSFRGLGLEAGLRVLAHVHEATGLPVTTDIHESCQAAPVAEVCEVLADSGLSGPANRSARGGRRHGPGGQRQEGAVPRPLGHAPRCGQAACGRLLADSAVRAGTFFGYGRLVNDMRAIPQMQSLGVPVIFDATHSVQEPGGLGSTTGGNRAMVEPLARAATAIGVDGLFFETHPDPDRSPSDGPNMVRAR